MTHRTTRVTAVFPCLQDVFRKTARRPLFAICALLTSLPCLRGQPAFTPEGFALPQPNHVFEFPRDHGSHPEFKIEWWYVTGHLFSAKGRRFGFEATFFREAGPKTGAALSSAPSVDPVGGAAASSLSSEQIYLAHMAVSDLADGRFLYQERLNREGWDASAARNTLDVRNGPWTLKSMDKMAATAATPGSMELRGTIRGDAAFDLALTPAKPLVVFGEKGLSRKSEESNAASYYLTFSRLATRGRITVGNDSYEVTGEAWMDHEISSSQLGSNQVGWDWLGIQLSDKRELMIYRMRRRDGSADPASTCTWVSPGAQIQTTPFTLETVDTWESPATNARYPSRVHLLTTDPATGKHVVFTIEPLLKSQELAGTLDNIPYWEGACRVLDQNQKEVGSAYLELTGYAKALKLE